MSDGPSSCTLLSAEAAHSKMKGLFMALVDEIPETGSRQVCKFVDILEQWGRGEVEEALLQRTSPAIAQFFSDRGYVMTRSTVDRHRHGRCFSCGLFRDRNDA